MDWLNEEKATLEIGDIKLTVESNGNGLYDCNVFINKTIMNSQYFDKSKEKLLDYVLQQAKNAINEIEGRIC